MAQLSPAIIANLNDMLSRHEFKVGQKVWYHDPIQGIMERARVGRVTFDHIVTNYAIVLDRPLTRANYPELPEYYEGWFAFSAPAGWIKLRYD